MSQERVNVLKDLGYHLDYNSTYLFKSISGDKLHEHTTVFIDLKTCEISFEGVDRFKEKLLKEIEEVLK